MTTTTTFYLCILICVTFLINMITNAIKQDKLEDMILDLKRKYQDLEKEITKK